MHVSPTPLALSTPLHMLGGARFHLAVTPQPSPPRTNSCSSLRFYLTPSLISSSTPTLPTGPCVSTFTPNTALTYDLTLDGSSPPLELVRTLCQL